MERGQEQNRRQKDEQQELEGLFSTGNGGSRLAPISAASGQRGAMLDSRSLQDSPEDFSFISIANVSTPMGAGRNSKNRFFRNPELASRKEVDAGRFLSQICSIQPKELWLVARLLELTALYLNTTTGKRIAKVRNHEGAREWKNKSDKWSESARTVEASAWKFFNLCQQLPGVHYLGTLENQTQRENFDNYMMQTSSPKNSTFKQIQAIFLQQVCNDGFKLDERETISLATALSEDNLMRIKNEVKTKLDEQIDDATLDVNIEALAAATQLPRTPETTSNIEKFFEELDNIIVRDCRTYGTKLQLLISELDIVARGIEEAGVFGQGKNSQFRGALLWLKGYFPAKEAGENSGLAEKSRVEESGTKKLSPDNRFSAYLREFPLKFEMGRNNSGEAISQGQIDKFRRKRLSQLLTNMKDKVYGIMLECRTKVSSKPTSVAYLVTTDFLQSMNCMGIKQEKADEEATLFGLRFSEIAENRSGNIREFFIGKLAQSIHAKSFGCGCDVDANLFNDPPFKEAYKKLSAYFDSMLEPSATVTNGYTDYMIYGNAIWVNGPAIDLSHKR